MSHAAAQLQESWDPLNTQQLLQAHTHPHPHKHKHKHTLALTTNLSRALSTAAFTAPVSWRGSPAAHAGWAGVSSAWLPSTQPRDANTAVPDSCRKASRLLTVLLACWSLGWAAAEAVGAVGSGSSTTVHVARRQPGQASTAQLLASDAACLVPSACNSPVLVLMMLRLTLLGTLCVGLAAWPEGLLAAVGWLRPGGNTPASGGWTSMQHDDQQHHELPCSLQLGAEGWKQQLTVVSPCLSV